VPGASWNLPGIVWHLTGISRNTVVVIGGPKEAVVNLTSTVQ
jgi:hypothetical protein